MIWYPKCVQFKYSLPLICYRVLQNWKNCSESIAYDIDFNKTAKCWPVDPKSCLPSDQPHTSSSHMSTTYQQLKETTTTQWIMSVWLYKHQRQKCMKSCSTHCKTFTLIPKPRKQDMGKATRLWLHQRQKIIINDLNWVTKANKFEITRAVVTTFWGYFLINPNTLASNGVSPSKFFSFCENRSSWCRNNKSYIPFKINLRKKILFPKNMTWRSCNVQETQWSYKCILNNFPTYKHTNLTKFCLEIRITKANAHNSFQILFFIRSSWKTSCLHWPFIVTLHIFLKGSFWNSSLWPSRSSNRK